MSLSPGVTVAPDGTTFVVRSPQASAVSLCLNDVPLAMEQEGDLWVAHVPRDCTGARYGYRADGEWAPDRGLWFDPAKLLVDPYATELDRRFAQHPSLAQFGVDTAPIVPRAIVTGPLPEAPPEPPKFDRAGLVYELNVRGFTMLHPDIPEQLRGTVAALAHPAIIAHLKKLHVSAVELMPVIAWIDERHLPPLGLSNAWGYNPVAMMALDPGLCPGGVAELRETVAALHRAGIGVILDVVLNHSGESDMHGGVISLRGLDDSAYAREADGQLVNITGCGNTLDFGHPHVRDLALAMMRHFVRHCGVDGFRFDLAPVMARGPGFDPAAPIFAEIAADPWLADRVMIAEPWDMGHGGYALGRFPANWLEWNDRYRDDVRRFWRGDAPIGELATRIAGSADIFGSQCRSVNFVAAHDGFTLADTVAYEHRHNLANGEENRDGHGHNFSWNNGVEGPTGDHHIQAARANDLRAMLGTLFASTGTIMLTAGDEFGRSQHGNNNAYAQDNAIGWIDWTARDRELEAHVARLAERRATHRDLFAAFPPDGQWRGLDGAELSPQDWQSPGTGGLSFRLGPVAITVDRQRREVRWD
ncbi:glycogen debranching protein GlgX [Altererythrobacter sp. KTW20L]|uniref:glycogen debranching protein GlgX n=1 Tax=Altererythrobacter sp. KTW20L TaxID=2942210 RepID=UPI0020BFD05A|nr:glycogen debranching protein GlgX [Altererythrobacter sp. KTW20L]MCL6251659.1 glycogen debranching protein GlgX [Altererythrobacter sp. KTW20L]